MDVLRAVVDDARVVRVDLDRRLPHEAVHHLLRIFSVALLRVNPEFLLLAGRHVHAAELALAVAVDDLSRGDRPHLSALAAGQRNPQLARIVGAPRGGREARHREVLARVLLRAVDQVRELLVGVDVIHLRRRLIELRRPAARAVLRDVHAAVVGLDHDLRGVGIEPDDVVVAVRLGDGRERAPAVGGLVQRELGDPHLVLVLRVHEDLVEVERTRAQRLAAVDDRPARAAVARSIQPALRALRLDLRVDHSRIRLRDVHPHLADEIVGEAAARARPVIAAVRGLVDAALGRGAAADDRPRPALRAPCAGVELVRVLPVDRDRDGAGLVVDEQHLLPRLAAVLRPVDAALRPPAERVADRRDVRDVGILRMNFQLPDLPDVLQPDVVPGAAGVGGLEDAAAEDHVRSNRFAARADVDDVGVGIRDVDGADRSGGDLPVGDGRPRQPVVLRFPHAAAGRAHVEDVRLRAYADGSRRSPAAVRADRSPSQILVCVRVDRVVAVRLRVDGRQRGVAAGDRDRRGDAAEQEQPFHDGSSNEKAILLPGVNSGPDGDV